MDHFISSLKSFNWNNFHFVPGVTPFTSTVWPVATCIVYFCSLRIVRKLMEPRKPLDAPNLVFAHNFLLSLGSLILFAALAQVLLELFFQKPDFSYMVCSKEVHSDGRLQFVYYVNYFFKYYELIDTFLLVLRKKPVAFLHEYHHAATLFLTWIQQREHSTVQWVPILLNLFVHVLMYYYYAMTALKINIWWKKYLTATQITQFIIDVTACVYAYATYYFTGNCHGTQLGAWSGIFILTSYLFLFIQFFQESYSNKPKSQKKQVQDAISDVKKIN